MKKPRGLNALIVLFIFSLLIVCNPGKTFGQNSMTGDGFGGRSWYVGHNYHVGSYSAFTVCGPGDQLYGWGSNLQGELGNGLNVSTTSPVAATGMTGVKFYATGYITTAIRKDSSAWAWGYLTNAAGTMFITVSPVRMLSNVKFADAGIGHVAFVKYDSTVWAAGQNDARQLGNGTTTPSAIPVQMTNIHNAVRVSSLGFGLSGAGTMILLADGTVKLAGGYPWFTSTNATTLQVIPGLVNIVDIKGNAAAAYALNAAGEVYSFGTETQYGSLGVGASPGQYMPPTKIIFPQGAAPIIALSATNDGTSALALDENGKVYGWGGNFDGQLGDGTFINRSRPVLVATNAIDISTGETFSYILKSDNTLWATGQNGGLSSSGSIWMNLPGVLRNVFTQIDPTIAPMNLCAPKPFGIYTAPVTPIIDSACRLDTSMKIYPVPSHHKLTIEKKPTLCKISMNVYNSIGQLVMQNKFINDGKNELELSNFTGGIYFLQFIANGRVVLTRKFVKG